MTATVTLGRVLFAPGGTPTTSSVRLLGSHGHAVADDDAPAVARFGVDGRTAIAADAGQVAAAAYLRHVVGAVLAGRRPDYAIEEARVARRDRRGVPLGRDGRRRRGGAPDGARGGEGLMEVVIAPAERLAVLAADAVEAVVRSGPGRCWGWRQARRR